MKIDEQYLRLRSIECGECWEWSHSYSSSGIPLLQRDGRNHAKTVRVKVVEDILGQDIPERHFASTKCENRKCVRPSHVQVISRAQMLDRSRKNTNETLRRAKITAARRVKSDVLSEELAAEIRSSDEKLSDLANRHGISMSLVSKIKRGESWAPASPFGAMFSGLLAANDHGRKRA